ncbi:LOW QUALITY PROTEIN: hypothetical protein U9M48_025919 [Paspalum notatum var. saurae]|uniref:Myb/SANT-like domain-containing protein n=1 Tax=Paspalum notatum var. saurae TaxID=547442 RepID=A0AAQ3WXM4_PASNO
MGAAPRLRKLSPQAFLLSSRISLKESSDPRGTAAWLSLVPAGHWAPAPRRLHQLSASSAAFFVSRGLLGMKRTAPMRSDHKRSGGISSSSGSCSSGASGASDPSTSSYLLSTLTASFLKHCSQTPTSLAPYRPGFPASLPNLTPFTCTDTQHPSVDECRAGNRPNKTLNRIGKGNIVQRLKDHTGRDWTWETCKHKWDELKKKWSCWKRLIKSNGIVFHPRTGLIDMPRNWWDKQIAANKLAKGFQQSRLEHEEQLDYIFAKMDPGNVSPNEVHGAEGGQAGVPTQYLDSDHSDASDADPQTRQPSPPPSQPVRMTSMSAASGKRQLSDLMVSNSLFWEGFSNFYQEISTLKKQKQTGKKDDEDAEYETFMKELLDGGLDPESDEYFMASEVLLDIPRRGAYRPLPTVRAKVAWIRRVYLSMKGQPPR